VGKNNEAQSIDFFFPCPNAKKNRRSLPSRTERESQTQTFPLCPVLLPLTVCCIKKKEKEKRGEWQLSYPNPFPVIYGKGGVKKEKKKKSGEKRETLTVTLLFSKKKRKKKEKEHSTFENF